MTRKVVALMLVLGLSPLGINACDENCNYTAKVVVRGLDGLALEGATVTLDANCCAGRTTKCADRTDPNGKVEFSMDKEECAASAEKSGYATRPIGLKWGKTTKCDAVVETEVVLTKM